MRIAIFLTLVYTAGAQTLEVTPPRIMADESAVIRASGLDPNERVIIRAELTDGAGAYWMSMAGFIADAQGTVDASRQAPAAGSYKDFSPMGLIWAMMPADKGNKVTAYLAPRNQGPQLIEFQLQRKNETVAKAQLEEDFLAEGVRRIDVHDGPLRGVFFVPPGTGRHPGVLVVGGSNGGLPVRPAAWLSSHGYAALALAYFRYDDLPQFLENIPLEYFGRALDWLAHRPEVSGGRFIVTGTSRGGELALQLGSMYPQIAAVAAYVPANIRITGCCRMNGAPAWLWNGRALPYAIPPLRGREESSAAIEVEKTHGPILVISGTDDGIWHSWEMAGEVVARLQRNHFPYEFEHLKYAHAGHYAGRPEIVPTWHTAVTNPTSGKANNPGGSPKGDAESSIDSMPKVLEFLRRALQ